MFVRLNVLAILLVVALTATAAGSRGLAQVLFVASLVFALGELGRWLNRRFNPIERRFEDQRRELAAAQEAADKAHEADRMRARVERDDVRRGEADRLMQTTDDVTRTPPRPDRSSPPA